MRDFLAFFPTLAVATGISSFAFGSEGRDSIDARHPDEYVDPAKATGNYAYAIGAGTQATARGSLAMGVGSIASRNYSTAIGYKTTASGRYSTAMGQETEASGSNSTAMGYSTTASGGSSTAMGFFTTASGPYSTAMGDNNTTASGKNSTAMGYYAKAPSYAEVAVGSSNTEYTPQSKTEWKEADRLFVIGNGERIYSKSDAVIVYKSGNMTVNGTITHKGLIESSDIRLKKDVQQLNGALDKVLKLRGVSFYWKSKEEMAAARGKDVSNFSYGFGSEKQIGVIAQEIEQVLPELVVTDNEGFKAVKYENLTPLLIEAVKEQQAIIDAQNKKIEELEAKAKEVDELKAQMKEILEKLK